MGSCGVHQPKSVALGDIHLATVKPLTGIIACAACKVFQSTMKQGGMPKDSSDVGVVPIDKGGPKLVAGNLLLVRLIGILCDMKEGSIRAHIFHCSVEH